MVRVSSASDVEEVLANFRKTCATLPEVPDQLPFELFASTQPSPAL
jgi:hypothetical protein